jgi:hypothetical protein
MSVLLDGRQMVPLNLDAQRKPKMSTTGILSITLLCVGIVVVLVYVVKLAVRKRPADREVVVGAASSVVHEPVYEPPQPVYEPVYEPPVERMVGAVGAVTTAAAQLAAQSQFPSQAFVEAAHDPSQPAGVNMDAVFGDLVSANMRREGPSDAMSVAKMMPASWSGARAPGARGDFFDDLFAPLDGAPTLNAEQTAMWGSSLGSAEAFALALTNSRPVDRDTFNRNSGGGKVGTNPFMFRIPSKGPAMSTEPNVFCESPYRMDVISTMSLGKYPVYSNSLA